MRKSRRVWRAVRWYFDITALAVPVRKVYPQLVACTSRWPGDFDQVLNIVRRNKNNHWLWRGPLICSCPFITASRAKCTLNTRVTFSWTSQEVLRQGILGAGWTDSTAHFRVITIPLAHNRVDHPSSSVVYRLVGLILSVQWINRSSSLAENLSFVVCALPARLPPSSSIMDLNPRVILIRKCGYSGALSQTGRCPENQAHDSEGTPQHPCTSAGESSVEQPA